MLVAQCVEAMGGMDNWNQTRCIAWNFFGRRMWHWDKWTGDVRCEFTDHSVRIAMNIHDQVGLVYAHDQVQTDRDSITKYMRLGYELWVNDSYWLVMPFKLSDPGTNLRYLGKQTTLDGKEAEVIELSFADVGVTPDNKYYVYFDPGSGLVCQWDYFRNYNDTDPRIQNPWTDYKPYSGILLSGGRGRRDISDIQVFKVCPDSIFDDISQSFLKD